MLSGSSPLSAIYVKSELRIPFPAYERKLHAGDHDYSGDGLLFFSTIPMNRLETRGPMQYTAIEMYCSFLPLQLYLKEATFCNTYCQNV